VFSGCVSTEFWQIVTDLFLKNSKEKGKRFWPHLNRGQKKVSSLFDLWLKQVKLSMDCYSHVPWCKKYPLVLLSYPCKIELSYPIFKSRKSTALSDDNQVNEARLLQLLQAWICNL